MYKRFWYHDMCSHTYRRVTHCQTSQLRVPRPPPAVLNKLPNHRPATTVTAVSQLPVVNHSVQKHLPNHPGMRLVVRLATTKKRQWIHPSLVLPKLVVAFSAGWRGKVQPTQLTLNIGNFLHKIIFLIFYFLNAHANDIEFLLKSLAI